MRDHRVSSGVVKNNDRTALHSGPCDTLRTGKEWLVVTIQENVDCNQRRENVPLPRNCWRPTAKIFHLKTVT